VWVCEDAAAIADAIRNHVFDYALVNMKVRHATTLDVIDYLNASGTPYAYFVKDEGKRLWLTPLQHKADIKPVMNMIKKQAAQKTGNGKHKHED
jgi:hypothetical protein